MDCSEEVQCVSKEPASQMELKKGMSIFIDVSKTFFYPYCNVNVSHQGLQFGIISIFCAKNLSMNVGLYNTITTASHIAKINSYINLSPTTTTTTPLLI